MSSSMFLRKFGVIYAGASDRRSCYCDRERRLFADQPKTVAYTLAVFNKGHTKPKTVAEHSVGGYAIVFDCEIEYASLPA